MRRAPLLFGLLFLAACDGDAPPTAPAGAPDASAILIDGTTDGNSHFFLLPPVAENPVASFTAPADASLFPRVEICQWDVALASCVDGGAKFTYTTTSGPNGSVVQVFSDHYQVQWDTQLPGIDIGMVFRASVSLVSLELGSVDLEIGANGSQVKNLNEDLVVGLVDGRTLPLNFRIEEGAVEEAEAEAEDPTVEGGACYDELGNVIDCDVEIIVTDEGGSATVEDPELDNPAGEVQVAAGDGFVNGEPVTDFQLTLQHVAEPPSLDLIPEQQVPYFIDVTAEDAEGNLVFFQQGALVTLCQPENLSIPPFEGAPPSNTFIPDEWHPSLRLFRVHDGVTELLETGIDDTLCPGGLHGGLNTVLTGSFSGFGATLVTVPGLSTAEVPDGLVGAPTLIEIQARVEAEEGSLPQIFGGDEVVVTVYGTNSAVLTVGDGIVDNGDGTYTASYTPGAAGTDQIDIRIRSLETGVLEPISGSPFTSLVAGGDITIDAVELSSTTLVIEGSGVPYTATVTNGTAATLTTVVFQGYIDQGEASRAAGGLQVICGAGTGALPPGTCTFDFSVNANNTTSSGSGTLVPGAATARFDLIDSDGAVLDSFTIPVTLVGELAIDGVISAGEWDGADVYPFSVNTPEGGVTPGELFVMNDDTNLYLAVQFAREVVDADNSLSFEFDSDGSSSISAFDDGMILNPDIGFTDVVRHACVVGGVPTLCSSADTSQGGTNDGAAAFGNDGTFTVYEFSHPLDSGDVLDVSLGAGDSIGLVLFLRMIEDGAVFPDGYGDTDFPAEGYLEITIDGIVIG